MISAHRSSSNLLLSIGLCVGVLWCLLSPLILFLFPGPFDDWDNLIYDMKLTLTAKPEPSGHVVHLDVDDDAILKYGQWPWDRKISADIVKKLFALGAKVVAFDILYTTKGKSPAGDEAFASAISQSGNVILAASPMEIKLNGGQIVGDEDTSRADSLYDRAWRLDTAPGFGFFRATELRQSGIPLIPLLAAARDLGHIKATPDSDGVHRRVPLFIMLEDRFIPTLAVAALAAYLDAGPDNIRLDEAGRVRIQARTGVYSIPVDPHTNMLINWHPVWERFPHYPVLDLFSDEPDETKAPRYKGKIVLVGVTWTGITDIAVGPLEPEVPGSRVHSNAMETILTSRFIKQIPPFPFVILGAVFASLAFIWVGARVPLMHCIILGVCISASYLILVVVAFAFGSLHVPLLHPDLIFVPTAALLVVFRAVSEERERQAIRDTFGRYISDEIVTEILERGVNLKGELREITVLVCDLRGFTALTSALQPTVVLESVNRYFERMTDIIMSHEGTIDAFTGDGILVFFGAPRVQPDHPRRAVLCALDMQQAMGPFNEESRGLSLPELQMGIGVSTGEVILGNIGSERRRSYTAVGGPINLAFRVEAQTKGGEILITPEVYEKVAEDVVVSSTRVACLKGIEKPVTLYLVAGFGKSAKSSAEAARASA